MITLSQRSMAAAIIGVFTIPKCHPYTLAWAFILWPISGNGITGGVHRLWAHRSYKVSYVNESLISILKTEMTWVFFRPLFPCVYFSCYLILSQIKAVFGIGLEIIVSIISIQR